MSRFGKANEAASQGSNGKSSFQKIGGLSVSKKTTEKLGDEIKKDLRESGVQLWLSVYPPKGYDTITLKKGDKVLLSLGDVKGKDGKVIPWVVGNASISVE